MVGSKKLTLDRYDGEHKQRDLTKSHVEKVIYILILACKVAPRVLVYFEYELEVLAMLAHLWWGSTRKCEISPPNKLSKVFARCL